MINIPLDSVVGTRIKIENSIGVFLSMGVNCLVHSYQEGLKQFSLHLNYMYFKVNDSKHCILCSDTLM